jgi:hypothetical protein
MSKHRIWLVNTVIVCLISGGLYDIIRDTDHWPFSNYAMYSEVERSHAVTMMRVFGVTDETPSRELPLTAFETIQPFDQYRLGTALEVLADSPKTQRDHLLRDALRDSLRRYEALRQAGKHHQPRLKGMKAYRLFWELDPLARNLDRPDRRTPIWEVTVDSDGRRLHD